MGLQVQSGTGTLIPQQVIDDIRATINPKETCGILTAGLKIYPIKNVALVINSFLMDKWQYLKSLNDIKSLGDSVLAIYHTHPFSDSKASAKDLEVFSRSNYDMLIVSQKDHTYYAKNK